MLLPRIKSVYISAGAGFFLMFMAGSSIGWSSPESAKLSNDTENPFGRNVLEDEISWISSIINLGAVVGPVLCGFLSDKLGRKPSMLLTAVPFLVSYVMLATGTVTNVFYCARLLAGIGLGGTFTVVPMYIGEISESRNRGLVSCLSGTGCAVGLLFAVSLGPFVSIQYFNAALAIPPLLYLIFFSILAVESPIYLVKKRKMEKAEIALHNLGRTPEVIKKDILEMQTEYENKEDSTFNLLEMLSSKIVLKGIFASLGLLIFQQLSGINAIMFFSQKIFEQAGTKLEPQFCTIILVSVQCGSSFIVPFVVDRFGRKFCLLISALGMIAAQGPLAIYCILRSSKINVEDFTWVPILSLATFIIFFNFGYGPLPWTILSEMFATKYRSFASAFVSAVCWMLSFIVTKYFGFAVNAFGLGNVFFFSTCCCALAVVFCCVFVVETKGKSLQEIQEVLSR